MWVEHESEASSVHSQFKKIVDQQAITDNVLSSSQVAQKGQQWRFSYLPAPSPKWQCSQQPFVIMCCTNCIQRADIVCGERKLCYTVCCTGLYSATIQRCIVLHDCELQCGGLPISVYFPFIYSAYSSPDSSLQGYLFYLVNTPLAAPCGVFFYFQLG